MDEKIVKDSQGLVKELVNDCMNDINKMPPKCQYCPYWEVCKFPWVCPDIGDKKSDLQPTCNQLATDCISRQAAIEAFTDALNDVGALDAEDINTVLQMLPPAQPERMRGRWIYGEDNLGTGRDGWFCSECGHFEKWDYSSDMKSAELNLPNYCPNCGADMSNE